MPGPVREALRELPRTERIAFLLRRDGLTAPETAAELNPHVPFCERFRWAALRAVACGAVTLRESGDLRLGRLWSGEPPDGGGRATLLTVDGAAPGAAPGTCVLISGDGRTLAGRGGTNSATASSLTTTAAALWWLSPRRWPLVAAAGPGITRLRAVGEPGERESGPVRPGEAPVPAVPGPRTGGERPGRARLPVVHVVAYERDGDRTVISPS